MDAAGPAQGSPTQRPRFNRGLKAVCAVLDSEPPNAANTEAPL